jgi:PhnB protein
MKETNMATHFLPKGYHQIVLQLAIEGAQAAIDFYKKAFGAEQLEFAIDPSGKKVWHCALRIQDTIIFVNDTFPEMGGGQSSSTMWLYVPDCDAQFNRAIEAGARQTMPVMEMFWGDRMGQVVDPFGQKWTIATHVKDMTPEEMKAAEEAFVASMKK